MTGTFTTARHYETQTFAQAHTHHTRTMAMKIRYEKGTLYILCGLKHLHPAVEVGLLQRHVVSSEACTMHN